MQTIPCSGPDEKFMRLALAEARRGAGLTHPNPAVGAVIVKNGRVLSRGFHKKAGGPHAEVEAIRALKDPAKARGAVIYVTLEPCSTHGQTPPCTEAIIESGFARVAYGAEDPNPKNRGRATRKLHAAGIASSAGTLAVECTALNEAWNKWIATGMPFVIAKAGMTLDGRIGSPPGERWITSTASRRDAMELRSRCQAILVGGETVRTDDPRLTLRGTGPGFQQPWRAVWTRSGDLPRTARLFTDSGKDRTIVYKGRSLASALRDLGKRGAACVLIEGGGRTLGEAFDRGLVDKAVFYIAPVITGGSVSAVAGKGAGSSLKAVQLADVRYSRIGNDVRVEGGTVAVPAG